MRQQRRALLLTGGIVLCVTMAVLLAASLYLTHGHLAYSLDDAYIHLSIAKQLAQHGVWGVTRYAFAPASSSLLFTLLLTAIDKVFGVHAATSLVLNTLCAFGVMAILASLIAPLPFPLWLKKIMLAGCFFAIPLPALIFSGMEHVLQIAFVLLYIPLVSRDIAGRETRRTFPWYHGLVPLLVLIRFESLFIVAGVCLLFLLRKRVGSALITLILGALPMAIWAWASIHHGGYWLPNSLLMKAGAPNFSHLGELAHYILQRIRDGAEQFFRSGDLVLLCSSAGLLLYARYRRYRECWEAKQVALILLVIVMLLHVVFARTGWFFRYEAYLIAWGLIANIAMLAELVGVTEQPVPVTRPDGWGGRLLMAFGLVVLLLPLVSRALFSLSITPYTTKNIYEQQCQMGKFLQSCYPHGSVVANDIGAVTYFTDVHCLDINGLASMDVARAIINGTFTQDTLAALARKENARVAILYDNSVIPPSWSKVGAWTISHNVVCAAPTVYFYAVDPAEVGPLTRHLQQFSSSLPPGVLQSGAYVHAH